MGLDTLLKRHRRSGLGRRLAGIIILSAALSLLVVGVALILISRSALKEQIVVRQQKTVNEAVLVSSAYLEGARSSLLLYSQGRPLLLYSLSSQERELRAMLDSSDEVFESLTLIDAHGREMARVSRYHTYSPAELGQQAGTPGFEQALGGQLYTSPDIHLSAQNGLPVLTIMVPHNQGGAQGVLAAEVTLQALWRSMARVEVGETGYVYMVDGRQGDLLGSTQSINLTLRPPVASRVPLVRRAMASGQLETGQYAGLNEQPVIGAAAPLPDSHWLVVVELPTREAMTNVRRMVWLLAGMLGLGVAAAAVGGMVMPGRIVRPIEALKAGAQQFGQGQLDRTIDIKTGDEIEDLAKTLNQMAADLKDSRDQVERWGRDLEVKVEERTHELSEASERMRRRTVQLQTSGEVAGAIASVRELDRLLPGVVQIISQRFGWYHAGIFMLDESGQFAVLRAANSEGGQRMLARGHRLRVGQEGLVGDAAGSGHPHIALDVGHDAVFFDNPDLPETRSEMSLPLTVGGQVIGVLDVQSTEPAAYDQEDVDVLKTLADQIALAIDNARLFDESRQALREVEAVHRQYLRQEWSRVVSKRGQMSYEYRNPGTPPLADFSPPEVALALTQGDVVAVPDIAALGTEPRELAARAALAAPIKLRDQAIGVLDLQSLGQPRYWSEDEVALVKSISDQVALALENVRLLEAEHEQRVVTEALREAAVTLSATLAYDDLLERILDQLGRVVPGDASNLMLIDADSSQVRIAASRGYEQFGDRNSMPGVTMPLADITTLQTMKRTGQPIVVPRTADYPGWINTAGKEWLQSYIGAPILIRGELVGMLSVDSALPGFFNEEHARQLAAFASQAAIALQNAQLMEETSRRAEQMAGLNRIGLALSSGLEVERVLETLYEQCRRAFHSDAFYVALYDEETDIISFPIARGLGNESPIAPRPLQEQPGMTGYIIKTRQPVLLPDLHALPADAPFGAMRWTDEPSRCFIGAPMLFRDRVVGVIAIQHREPSAYAQSDVDLLTTIASQASIAIENARAYQRLMDTAEQLREVDQLKNQFLANMSHELRTPLNSIIGFSRVMLKGIDGPLTEVQAADLTSIYNSGQHLLSLINGILDMAKIEAGRMDLSLEEVRLDDVFQSALSTARALVKDRPIELLSTAPDNLPSVWADGQRVRQVMINLLSNAAKFTEQGQIVMHAEVGPEFVTISVRDTGIGIDPEAQKKLFVPFQQVDASSTRRAGGTGLGLAICRSFVEMQGGQIWLESELGQGSTFYFTLPIYQVMRAKIESEKVEAPDDQKRTVLVIDDDTGVITLLKRYLEHDNYQVAGVTQPRRALEMAQQLAPNLVAITLDVMMPQMDGWQVLKALKEEPATRDVPVILCSIVEGLERGLSMGAAATLSKPVTRDELLAVLEKVGRQPQGVPGRS